MKKLLLIILLPSSINCWAQSRYNNVQQSQKYVSTHVPTDYEEIRRAGEARQHRDEMEEAYAEQQVIQCKRQIMNYYNSLNKYNDVMNGWHKVYVLSVDNSLCETRQVYVQNNKITRYLAGDGTERSISNTFTIVNAKTLVELVIPEEPNSLNTVLFLE